MDAECEDLETEGRPIPHWEGKSTRGLNKDKESYWANTAPLPRQLPGPGAGGCQLSLGPRPPWGLLPAEIDTGQRAVAPPLPSGPSPPVLLSWALLRGCSLGPRCPLSLQSLLLLWPVGAPEPHARP